MSELRQKFEELPDIKGIIYGSDFGFNESLNQYYHPDHTNHRLNYAFIMGAWCAFQSQQAEIDQLKAKNTQLTHALVNANAEKSKWQRINSDLQKRIDDYEKLTTSIRNEFDLWSDDSEFADVIEAQIKNLEALRGAND